ncbi:MAG: DUF1501 domain-containing protein [Planctomycetota bacterium]|nr:DUF1501 domain-containing protein [Planctomycetota bacterium]MDA1213370.1 DUF1501 domain-containing protein [Planctomycetota bacterium]
MHVLNRRQLLSVTGVSVSALALPQLLRAREANAAAPARQVIMILCQGGMPQHDTFDLKPEAPSEYRGEFRPISTSIPGYGICEHLPLFAERAHKFNFLRSVYHRNPSHEAAIHWVLTGYDYPGANTTTKNRNIRPGMGSVVAKLKGSTKPGLPPYVCIPDKGQLGDRVRYAGASYLGMAFDPFETQETPGNATAKFAIPPNLSLPSEIDLSRFDHRRQLLRNLDQFSSSLDRSGVMTGVDTFNRKAYELLAHDNIRQAFDMSQESPEMRMRYGSHRVGQQALLARRLAEAGVPFTLVNFSRNQEWDTHGQNFKQLKDKLLPTMEQAVTTLVDDLEERDLLDSTLVVLLSEFGRTPKINNTAGRDHWGDVFSVVMAGGGLKRGQVIGTSNPRGEIPQDRPVHYHEVYATIFQQMGIPLDAVLHDQDDRPIPIVYEGQPIPELV